MEAPRHDGDDALVRILARRVWDIHDLNRASERRLNRICDVDSLRVDAVCQIKRTARIAGAWLERKSAPGAHFPCRVKRACRCTAGSY